MSSNHPLAVTLSETADYRASLVEDFPEDERNTASAEALRAMATWVDEEHDSSVERLDELVENHREMTGVDYYANGRFIAGHEAKKTIGLFGFHPVSSLRIGQYADFVDDVIKATIHDMQEDDVMEQQVSVDR